MSQIQIAAQLGISRGQVSYSLRRGNISPKKKRGPLPMLSTEEVDRIITFIESSPKNRRLTYLELASDPFNYLGVSERVIQKELKKRGCLRHLAHAKPPGSESTWRMLKEWAEAHLHWTLNDWMRIPWTDETLVNDEKHSRESVTRSVSIFLLKTESVTLILWVRPAKSTT